jgi:predicted AAA+ superfamily ATPase
MISKDTLRQIAYRQKSLFSAESETVGRELLERILPWMTDRRIVVLTGIRRCGKSTLLKQLSRKEKNWCYFNFEDERLLEFRAKDFELLREVLLEVYGSDECCFFDEIQNVEKFEIFLRRIQDEGKKVIITGSNASLLSRELGTRLTGRYMAFELYPFSFREFLEFKKIKTEPDELFFTEKRVELIEAFASYATRGGFPEYLKNEDTEYIQILYENIIYRDIIARYSLKRERLLKELVGLLARQISSRFTYNALKKNLGLSNSITVKEYIGYLSNSYLFFETPKFSFSLKQQLSAPKKIYLIDPVILEVCGSVFSPNKGRILENVIFNELQRQGKEVAYFAGKNECDFVIREKNKVNQLIQVCYTLDDETHDRELAGLDEAMDFCHAASRIIITWEQSFEIPSSSGTIPVIPAWRWLLGKW